MSRQEIIDDHLSNSNLNENIDILTNENTLKNIIVSNIGIDAFDVYRRVIEEKTIEDIAYTNDFNILNEKLINAGESPLTAEEMKSMG